MKQVIDKNKQLFEIAESQQGLFTAKQADEIGFIRTNHAYHVRAGNWIREERGIYSLALFPRTQEQQLVTYALWSQNRKSKIQGVYSFETALSHYELSDLNPAKLHITVPKNFRRNSKIPGVLVLHYADIPKDDIQESRGFLVTKPIRTIQDVVESNRISFEFIEQAISEALSRGLIRKSQLRNLLTKMNISESVRLQLDKILKEVA